MDKLLRMAKNGVIMLFIKPTDSVQYSTSISNDSDKLLTKEIDNRTANFEMKTIFLRQNFQPSYNCYFYSCK